MTHLLDSVLASAAATPLLEWLGVATALVYLLLAVRQHPACWFLAIASALIYLVLFARAGLHMQSLLQVFYAAMAVYGWHAWRRGGDGGARLPVQRWPWQRHLAVLAIVAVITIVNAAWLARQADAVAPYADAAITWGSVATTWLLARKVLENWLYWIVLDLAAAVLFASQGLAATAMLFVVYALIAARAYVRWRREMHTGQRANVALDGA